MQEETLSVGIDIGSTTVKTVAVRGDREIVLKLYDRHETRQAEVLKRQIATIEERFPGSRLGFFATGSGAGRIAPVVGATFVQEVNAVEMAVDTLLPGTGSVIELGGQDAKIIVWKTDPRGNRRSAITMNDKCAGGTGATIDRILVKAGLDPERAARLPFDGARIHKIAARCGVFAETDVVCLLKTGIPESEIMPSLFAAIVKQNLEVLTRGNVLRERVVLLGGPHRFFPALADCWRAQIPLHWKERGYEPSSGDAGSLIVCPEDAEYYAAVGAVLYGRCELEQTAGMDQGDRIPARAWVAAQRLGEFIESGRAAQLATSGKSRPGLVGSEREKQAFLEAYTPRQGPAPRPIEPGSTLRVWLGIDGGSTSTKAVLLHEDGELAASAYALSAGNPLEDARGILRKLKEGIEARGAKVEVIGAGATGYAGRILGRTLQLDSVIVETVAHMLSAIRYHGDVDVICDVGGQDIKIIFMKDGRIRDFRFNTQCSAGNGYFLQSMARQFDVPLEEYAERAFRDRVAPSFLYGCAVFMEQDKVNLQQLGWSADEMLAGLALVLPLNIWQYVAQVRDIGRYGRRFVLQGGTQRNMAAVKAQVDYIMERVPDAEVMVHRHAAECGAIGAALEAMRMVERRGKSTFVGIDQAIGLEFESRNDEGTRCTFCPNGCSRTFIDARTPSGATTRYIAGFSCEKGQTESAEAMKVVAESARKRLADTPNLVQESFGSVFSEFPFEPLPGKTGRRAIERRGALRVGIPRALTLYQSAPYFTTFLRALGVGSVVFSSVTSEKLWERGGKWGTIDPCFPAKVANAHVHDLLAGGKVDAILFPMVECLGTHLDGVKGSWACTIETATPEVVEACFTKEKDRFVEAGVKFWKPLVNLERRREAEEAMFEYFSDRLGVTRGEVAHASVQGFKALDEHRARLRRRGREVMDAAAAGGDLVIACLARPYHSDPGLNHGILRKFQLRGYPVVGVESIPEDEDFLAPLFAGAGGQPEVAARDGVLDVWKRAYNHESNCKLWSAKVAARHPNMVAVEVTSFKCGYDYSISSTLERIAGAARSPYFMFRDLDQNRSESALDLRIESIAYFLDRLRDDLRSRRPGATAPAAEGGN